MFIEDNNLYTYQDGQPTFFHPNGHVQAEIDYILTNYSANELLSHVTNEGIHHDNVSDHVPLSTEIKIRTQLRNPVISTQPKPRWEKLNKEAYQNTRISNFGTIKSAMFRNINEDISELRRVLVTAVQKSIPGSNQLSKLKKPKPYFLRNPEIVDASKKSKRAWWAWKANGATVDPENRFWVAMKDCKRKLRQILRRQAAAKNEEVLEDIMHSEDNGKTFYKLINIQRSSLKTTTNCFDIKGKLLTSDKEITEGWAEHFEYLKIQFQL